MAAATVRAGARNGSGAALPSLPAVSVARFKEASLLLEQLVDENADAFIAAGQRYREKHRDGTVRPLQPNEVATIAAGLGVSLREANDAITEAGLTSHAEPEPQELLLQAGIATAEAFIHAGLRFTALIEMPADVFMQARENGSLRDAIEAAAVELEAIDLKIARQRATRALTHLAENAGVEPGKALGLITGPVWQALQEALRHLMDQRSPTSSGSSTSSPSPTAGIDGPSSTTPPTTTS